MTTSAGRTDPVLELFDRRVTAADLCSDAFLLPADATATVARRALRAHGFDTAPVALGGGAIGLVDLAALDDAPAGAEVASRCRPVPDGAWVASAAPLSTVLRALREQPFLVLRAPGGGTSVAGVITRRDLDRPVAGLAVLGLVVRSEARLDVLIDRAASGAGGWQALLPPERAVKLAAVRAYLRRPGYDLGPMSTLNLDDRLTLVSKLPTLREALGWPSRASFRRFAEPLRRMRDAIAHGGGLLGAVPDSVEALEVVLALRVLVERIDELIAQDWVPAAAAPAPPA